MVASDGAVYERYWDDKSWIWISHGTPSGCYLLVNLNTRFNKTSIDAQVLLAGVRAVPARPVALDNRHIFFLREDSLLAERSFATTFALDISYV